VKISMSCDDGCASDVRVAALAEKHNVPCVFYWPVEWQSLAYDKGYEPLAYDQALDIANVHEVGAHTITHRHLTKIPFDEACREIKDCQEKIGALLGIWPYKFCPPRGYTNKDLTEFTMKFYESQRLTKGPGLVHVHPDSGANNNAPWRMAAFQQAGPKQNQPIELWFHSWELDKYNLWDELEEYLHENISS